MIAFLFFLLSINTHSAPITISHKQDINFGTLVQGDSKKVISPKNSEPNNARFLVKGDANTTYTIILPDFIYIYLNGSGQKKIKVNRFKSKPHTTGKLNKKGKQNIRIGATLARIGVNKPPGSYYGSFTVDVVY